MEFGTPYPTEEEMGQTNTRSSSYERSIENWGACRQRLPLSEVELGRGLPLSEVGLGRGYIWRMV